jgi:uncharacterized membrane protein YdbT with pleckstrin-like domain
MHEEERTLWEGRPSHVRDVPFHVLCLLTAWLVVPVFASLRRYLSTRFHRYEVTTERIQITTGILSKHLEEIELYRVKDTSLQQPWFLRLFGLSNILIRTSDQTTPVVILAAVPNGRVLRENLRGCVEKQRDKTRTRELDFA